MHIKMYVYFNALQTYLTFCAIKYGTPVRQLSTSLTLKGTAKQLIWCLQVCPIMINFSVVTTSIIQLSKEYEAPCAVKNIIAIINYDLYTCDWQKKKEKGVINKSKMFSITKKICFPPTGRPVILARSAVKAHKEGVRNLGQSVGMSIQWFGLYPDFPVYHGIYLAMASLWYLPNIYSRSRYHWHCLYIQGVH